MTPDHRHLWPATGGYVCTNKPAHKYRRTGRQLVLWPASAMKKMTVERMA